MALNWDKYDIEVQDDDTIKCNRIFFDFMQQMFSCLYGLYMHEKCLLMDTIREYQFSKQSAAEFEILNRDKNNRNKKRKVHLSLLPKRMFCE